MFKTNYNIEENELASSLQVQGLKKFEDKNAQSAFMLGRYSLHLLTDYIKKSQNCTLCKFVIISLPNSVV